MINMSAVDPATLQYCTSRDHASLVSVNVWCAKTVFIINKATVSKSQNVKDRSHANKYLRNIKVNLRTKVGICISTYSNAHVV